MHEQLLFVPGGPGFSSNFEAQVLSFPLAEAGYDPIFWRQPWRLGDAPSLAGELGSLDRQLHALGAADTTLVCHSAAAHHALLLLSRGLHPGRLVLIAPTLDLRDAHGRLLNFAAGDFARQGRRDIASAIRNLMADSSVLFDAPAREALALATHDRDLLQHYWHDQHALGGFALAHEFRSDAFLAVVGDLVNTALAHARPRTPYPLKVTAVFGDRDPIVETTETLHALMRLFAAVEPIVIPGAGHWPHCERPREFAELLRHAATRRGDRSGGPFHSHSPA
jgi:pimeloyl-ACP methyl ester carboxylesterase